MSNRKQIKKLKKKLKRLGKIVKKDCITITNSANKNESIKFSFINNVVEIKKITISEHTEQISDVTFN